MPKRKTPKVIYQEIMRALQALTNKNPSKAVEIGDIVIRAQSELEKKAKKIKNLRVEIKKAAIQLRDMGLIGYQGRGQYSWPVLFNESTNSNTQATLPTKPDAKHFEPYTRKKEELEKKGCCDPNRKRNSETNSISSLSGDEIDRIRKRGEKTFEAMGKKVALPKARRVPTSQGAELATAFSDSEVIVKRLRFDNIDDDEVLEETAELTYKHGLGENEIAGEDVNFGDIESIAESDIV